MNPEIAPLERALELDSIDDYATALAYVRFYGARLETWTALGVAEAEMLIANRWVKRMADAAFAGDPAIVDRFDASFRSAMDRLRRHADARDGDREISRSDATPPPVIERGPSVLEASDRACGLTPAPTRAPVADMVSAEDGVDTQLCEAIDPLESTLSVELIRPDVLPFAPSPTISVEQYASMCASLAAFPEKRSLIWARYAVADAAQFEAIQAGFQAYFARAPAALAAYRARLAEVTSRLGKES